MKDLMKTLELVGYVFAAYNTGALTAHEQAQIDEIVLKAVERKRAEDPAYEAVWGNEIRRINRLAKEEATRV